jgi:hypothetical protein
MSNRAEIWILNALSVARKSIKKKCIYQTDLNHYKNQFVCTRNKQHGLEVSALLLQRKCFVNSVAYTRFVVVKTETAVVTEFTLRRNRSVNRWLATDWTNGVRFPAGHMRTFLSATTSRPALRPTEPPIQWVLGVTRPKRAKLTIHLHLVPALRMREVSHPLPHTHTSSWGWYLWNLNFSFLKHAQFKTSEYKDAERAKTLELYF